LSLILIWVGNVGVRSRILDIKTLVEIAADIAQLSLQLGSALKLILQIVLNLLLLELHQFE
jgi:hypothetical protein